MKLQHNNYDERYGEESQDRPCRFFFAKVVKGVLNTYHGPVLCRDFLGDTLVWKAGEEPVCSIYGWKYNGPVETKYTSLVIDNFGKIEENVKNVLNPIERDIGIELTEVSILDKEHLCDGDHVWIRGDKWWMTTTVHFSWYTTMLRYLTYDVAFNHIEQLKDYPTNDWMTEEAFEKFVQLPYILPKLKFVSVRGAAKNCQGSTMHDYNGWYTNVGMHKWKAKNTVYWKQLREHFA